MHRVAAEMRHSETAFAHPLPAGGEADWALRWFTPAVETHLCGHATLATAHALYEDRGAGGTVRFASRSGVLVAHTRADGSITLDFPAAPATEVAVPDGLIDALGARPRATYATGALRDLLAVFGDEAAVRALAPGPRRSRASRGATASAASSPPPRPRTAAATTSSRASSPPATGSPRTR